MTNRYPPDVARRLAKMRGTPRSRAAAAWLFCPWRDCLHCHDLAKCPAAIVADTLAQARRDRDDHDAQLDLFS